MFRFYSVEVNKWLLSVNKAVEWTGYIRAYAHHIAVATAAVGSPVLPYRHWLQVLILRIGLSEAKWLLGHHGRETSAVHLHWYHRPDGHRLS